MYGAAILFLGHPYIESATALFDTVSETYMYIHNITLFCEALVPKIYYLMEVQVANLSLCVHVQYMYAVLHVCLVSTIYGGGFNLIIWQCSKKSTHPL